MDAALWALVGPFILAGAPSNTASVSMAPTGDDQYTYVVASECRQGHGWLVKSNRDGTNVRRSGYYVLSPHTPHGTAPDLARVLCYPFNFIPRSLP